MWKLLWLPLSTPITAECFTDISESRSNFSLQSSCLFCSSVSQLQLRASGMSGRYLGRLQLGEQKVRQAAVAHKSAVRECCVTGLCDQCRNKILLQVGIIPFQAPQICYDRRWSLTFRNLNCILHSTMCLLVLILRHSSIFPFRWK